MAHIKSIKFDRVGKQEGCTCDRCGQYIQNIWTVNYVEGIQMHYGIDCWEKISKQSLNKVGIKELKKVMKSIESYENRLASYVNGEMTEETDESYKSCQADWNKDDYWHGKSFEEYKDWMVNEFFPNRINDKQKDLQKFKKVNFEA